MVSVVVCQSNDVHWPKSSQELVEELCHFLLLLYVVVDSKYVARSVHPLRVFSFLDIPITIQPAIIQIIFGVPL